MKKANLIKSCPICGSTAVPAGGFFCVECSSRLELDRLDSYMARCPRCHHPLVSHDYRCPHCYGRDSFLPIFSISDYKCPFSCSLLDCMKFGLDKGVCRILARILEPVLRLHFAGYLVVPVPCSPQGLRKRGFDQMLETCRHIRSNAVLPVLENTGLREQKRLTKSQRKSSSEGKYRLAASLTPAQLQLLQRSNVVLLDDLTTTGSTLESCAQVLMAAGCRHVEALTWLTEL